MSEAALEELVAREEALVAALDSGEIESLERATQDMLDALSKVAATGGWRARGDLALRLTHALRLAEAAGGRINYLADANRRRLDRLATLAGQAPAAGYKRSGRLA